MDEKKRIINLQILDAVISLKISDENEETVRCAAKKLNDRANDIKEKNPTFESTTLLAYLALEECIGSMNKDKKKNEGFFKRIAIFISEKMNQLFTDE